MRMTDAAHQVLKRLDRPATAHEIYDEIVRCDSFNFGAKHPVSVLRSTLRKHTEGSRVLSGQARFSSPSPGLFTAL